MKAKTKLLFFPIFLGLISGLIFLPNNVDAVSYYNWIQNPSFTTYTNYCEDGGFESGDFENGVTYGNWTESLGGDIQSDYFHSGVYGVKLSDTDDENAHIIYNLTEPLLGGDVVSFTYWHKDWFGPNQPHSGIHFYYGDESSDFFDGDEAESSWDQKDATDTIDDSKYIVAIGVVGHGTGSGLVVDDFVLLVDDGEGQDEIVFGGDNYWQLGQTSGSFAPYFGHINTVFGRIDNTSCQLDSPSETYKIIQYIDFLDSDTIHYINLYIYGADVADGEGIKIKLLYNDGSTDEKTVLATGDGSSWEELNFGKSWIDSGKYVMLVYIYPVFDGEAGSFNIDDVGVWCSIPYGYNKFQFTISPYPIEKGSYDFDAYSETTYTFTGYFYNVTDLSLSINGTYQIGDSFGLHSGDMTNGLFSLQLNKRSFTASPYTLETLSVTIITDDEIFNVDIRAYWYPASGGVDTGDAEETSSLVLDFFMYGIFFIAIPLTMSFYVGGINNPSLGITVFLGAETLMGAIALSIGLISLWFMVVILIVDILLIFVMIRNNRG